MKCDQDLCLNLWYELNPRVRCAFGYVLSTSFCGQILANIKFGLKMGQALLEASDDSKQI